MKAETLDRGRLAVTNPIDDTHETFNHLKDAGITEAQAEVFTQTFKGLADQTMQVNENLLMVRDELRGEITDIHLKLKDIDHKIDSNHQKLDTKIDSNHQKLDAKIDSNHQKLDAKIDGNFQTLDAKIDKNQMKLEADLASTNQQVKHTRETLSTQIDAKFAQVQNSMMRWNIGLFIGLAGLMVALIRPWE